MKHILKARWVILCVWVIITIVLTAIQPDINAILSKRGQTALSDSSPSVLANDLMKKMDTTKGSQGIIVFYDKNGISTSEMKSISNAVMKVTDSADELGIGDIIDPFSNEAAKSSLISKDNTTVMTTFKLNRGDREMDEIISAFDNKLEGVDTEYYLTGEEFIQNDYLNASVAGVDRSAVLTVIFILVVLIIMFRSVITPIVSLLAVAFSYLVSMGITAQLIDKANFPVTTLTQILMILILFGIGTDYNILLFNRFKEELSHGLSVDDAIIATYKTAGKTIIFSVLTVLIAFLSLIFSESPIYKSGICVVIGTAVLILEILTLTPFAMKTLGTKIFWPSKKVTGHKESKLWGFLSTFSTKRYLFSLSIVALVVGGSVLGYQQKLNFDQVGELGNSHSSSKGFNIVADHFGKGNAMPSVLVISNSKTLDNNDFLSEIDKITEDIKSIDGVKSVSSVTQPQGERIDEFYINTQMSTLGDGLTTINDGVNQINGGFSQAEEKLGSADLSKVDELVNGTQKLNDAIGALTNGIADLKNGLDNGNTKSQSVLGGITQIKSSINNLNSGVQTLSKSYTTIQAGFDQMGTHYQDTATALLNVKSALTQVQPVFTSLSATYPQLNSDRSYLTLKGTIEQLVISLETITPEKISELNKNYTTATAGFAKANESLIAVSDGLTQISAGLNKLESGVDTAANGAQTIITNMQSVSEGLEKIADGQKQLSTGLGSLSGFSDQLTKVTEALTDISDGIGQSKDFLAQFNSDKTFHLPNEAFDSDDFKTALDFYMSADRTTTKMTIVLDEDPYSLDAASTINHINTTVSNDLKGSLLSDAEFGVSGPSSTTNDMNHTLSSDLNRMIVIVLAGVFIVLLVVIRSFWIPVFITLGLMGSYMISIFVSNTLFIKIIGYPGLSSFVPFFSFLAVVALGVDYSIFLMMRYREFKHMSSKDAIVAASKQVGGVVMSAVIILGGTFATLIPSGMLILIELAVTVIVGLIVLCFIILPVFLPASISLADRITRLKDRDTSI